MGPEGNILENSSISTFQQGLTHSALDHWSIGAYPQSSSGHFFMNFSLIMRSCHPVTHLERSVQEKLSHQKVYKSYNSRPNLWNVASNGPNRHTRSLRWARCKALRAPLAGKVKMCLSICIKVTKNTYPLQTSCQQVLQSTKQRNIFEILARLTF